MSWSEPSAMASMAKPKKSKRRTTRSARGSQAAQPRKATMPTGRLMKKTQRQSQLSVSQPPSVGPMIGPTMIPAPQSAMACPAFSRGLMSSRKVCDSGTMAAPKTPCSSRKPTIEGRLQDRPQAIEASVKPTIETRNSSRLPIRSASQPVTGVMIAAATM